MIHSVDPRQNRLFDPFDGVIPPAGRKIIGNGWQGVFRRVLAASVQKPSARCWAGWEGGRRRMTNGPARVVIWLEGGARKPPSAAGGTGGLLLRPVRFDATAQGLEGPSGDEPHTVGLEQRRTPREHFIGR
jgi:hypothetical protein